MKFSAFNRQERDYSVDKDEQWKKRMGAVDKPFEVKPEYSRIPFDENIRNRHDDFSADLMYRGIEGHMR
jgi:hypothetical protein